MLTAMDNLRSQKQLFFSETEPYFWYSAGESIQEGALWYKPTTSRLFRYNTGEWKTVTSANLTAFRGFYKQAFTADRADSAYRSHEQHVFEGYDYKITIVGQSPKTIFLFHDHLPDKKIEANYSATNEALMEKIGVYLEQIAGQEIDEVTLKQWIESDHPF